MEKNTYSLLIGEAIKRQDHVLISMAQGVPATEIADQLGVSITRVYQIRKQGLARMKRHGTESGLDEYMHYMALMECVK